MNEAMTKVRDYIALVMTLGMLLFVGLHVAIPDRLWDVYLAIIMFFFGSKQATGDATIGAPKAIVAQSEVKP